MSTIHANGMYDSAGNVVTFGGGEGASLLRADYETSPATAAHAIDDILYYNNKFYDVTSAIAIGDTLTASSGGNISARPGGMSYEVFGIPGGGSGGTVIADDISYDNTSSGLNATKVQGAIDEVNSNKAGVVSDIGATTHTVNLPTTVISRGIGTIIYDQAFNNNGYIGIIAEREGWHLTWLPSTPTNISFSSNDLTFTISAYDRIEILG